MRSLAVPTSVRRPPAAEGDESAGRPTRGSVTPEPQPPSRRPPRTSRRTRLILALLVLAAVCRGVVWVAAMPPWQGPDEQSHYAYAAEVGQGNLLPADRSWFSATPALAVSVRRAAWNGYQLRNHDRPHTPAQVAQIEREPDGLPDRYVSVIQYPPLAYLVLAPAYRLPGLGTATDRMYAMRLLLVLVGAGLVPLTFLLARELVADDRLALAAAALVSVAPIVTHASAVVNADIVLTVFTTALALASLQVVTRGPTWPRVLAVAALGLAVAFTKPIGPPTAAIVAGTLIGVPLALRLLRRPGLVTAAWVAGCVVVLAVLTHVRTPVKGLDGARFAASYLWQFYLPGLPGMTPVARPELLGEPVAAWPVWGKGGVGWFGWLSVQLQPWIYLLGVGSVGVIAALAALGLLRRRGGDEASARRLAGVAALTVALFVLLLHTVEIQYLPAAGQPLLQARYLLPVVPLAAVVLAAGVARLGSRTALTAMLGLVAVWTLISVAAVNSVLQFYAG